MLLAAKINNAPETPGCYLFRNNQGQVIYVGKGKNLRNRVKQYYQKNNPNEKVQRMVRVIADVDYLTTDTELDALLHEHRLIKAHKPWYNAQLKQDVRHPYIKIDLRGEYAALYIVLEKHAESKKEQYYGSFYDIDDAKNALETIGRVWKTPVCGKSIFSPSGRACLNYHLGACLAPCEGRADRENYKKIITEVIHFLQGKRSSALSRLEKQMQNHVKALEYEKAAACQELLSALRHLQQKCRKMYHFPPDRDLLLFIRAYRASAFSIFLIKSGSIVCRQDFQSDLQGDLFDEAQLRERIVSFETAETALNDNGWLSKALTEIYADKLFFLLPNKKKYDIFHSVREGYRLFAAAAKEKE